MGRIIIKMSDIVKKEYVPGHKDPFAGPPPSQPVVRALDDWLQRERIYRVPGAKMLLDLYKHYTWPQFLEVISQRPGSDVDPGDAAKIWRAMDQLMKGAPQIY